MTDDSTPEGTVEQDASAPNADALLDRFLGVSEEEDTPNEQDETEQAAEAQSEEADTDLPADDDAGKEDDAKEEQEGESQAESEAGRFVGHDGRVRLPDGTVTTVNELIRGNLREADYTRKTQETAALREELQSRQAELAQREQTIDLAIDIARAYLPQEPDQSMIHTDPIGYLQQKAEYDARMGQLQQLYAARQQAEQARSTQTVEQKKEVLRREAEALFHAMPELRDPAKLNQFNADMVKAVERYGFSPQDVAAAEDHRLFLLARDAMAYQKLMAAKPKAMAKTEGKPPLAPGRRQSPQGAKQRDRQSDWQRVRSSHGKDNDALDRILDDLI